jgi:hypothetical protein
MDLRFFTGNEICGLETADMEFILALSRCTDTPINQWTGLPSKVEISTPEDGININLEEYMKECEIHNENSKFPTGIDTLVF